MQRASLRISSLIALLTIASAGCDGPTDPTRAELRVRNVGTIPIGALRVAFPGSVLEFGDISTGAATGYKPTAGE